MVFRMSSLFGKMQNVSQLTIMDQLNYVLKV